VPAALGFERRRLGQQMGQPLRFAALTALEAGLGEIARDETVTLADLRSELAERRAAAG
jgi:hypothetical protein